MINLIICGVVFIYVLYKWIQKRRDWHEEILVIDNYEKCQNVVRTLKSHCDQHKVIGIRCMYQIYSDTFTSCRRPISIMVLVSHRGLCAIFLLKYFETLPWELKEILEDDSIVKVGEFDAIYLFEDFDVQVAPTFDLRIMAEPAGHKGCSYTLAIMTEFVLRMDFSCIPLYPWEDYSRVDWAHASTFAYAAMKLFRLFSSELKTKLSQRSLAKVMDTYCRPFLNKYYPNPLKNSGTMAEVSFTRPVFAFAESGMRYTIPKKNRCLSCGETEKFSKYFPYILEQFAAVIALCECCHKNVYRKYSTVLTYVKLFIKKCDLPNWNYCTTLNLDKVSKFNFEQSQVPEAMDFSTNISSLFQHLKVHVIDNFVTCRKLMSDIKRDCDQIPVLSLDCEWVPSVRSHPRNPVSLLQLTTHHGLCVLIRLCRVKPFPADLREILENKEILKVGVEVQRDAAYLFEDYQVTVPNTLDLRDMAEEAGCQPASLGRMTEGYLNEKLDKEDFIIHFAWENDELQPHQIQYAAKDAIAGMGLFKFFANKLQAATYVNKYMFSRNNLRNRSTHSTK